MNRTINRLIRRYEQFNHDLDHIRLTSDEDLGDWIADRIAENRRTIDMLRLL